jgi:hypothetical protein
MQASTPLSGSSPGVDGKDEKIVSVTTLAAVVTDVLVDVKRRKPRSFFPLCRSNSAQLSH